MGLGSGVFTASAFGAGVFSEGVFGVDVFEVVDGVFEVVDSVFDAVDGVFFKVGLLDGDAFGDWGFAGDVILLLAGDLESRLRA